MKTKKEVCQASLDSAYETLYAYEIVEKYLGRKALTGNEETKLVLGKTQRDIKEKKEFIKFLEEHIKEL